MKNLHLTILIILLATFFSHGQSVPGALDFNWGQGFIPGTESGLVLSIGLTDITESESDKLKDWISEGAEVETISDLRELLDQVRLENSLPEAPTGLWVSPQDGALQINFTEGNEGDSPILNYQYTLDGGQTWLDFSPAVIGSPLTITGLDNGTAYDIQIRALNATGEGVPSERVSATPGSQAFTYTMTWNNISGSYAGNSFTDQTLTFTFLNVLPDDFVDWITPNSRVVFPNGEKVKITLGDILINVPLDNIESNTIFLGAIDTYIFLSQINGYNRGGLQGFSPNPPSSSKLTSFWQSSASEAYFANQILWSPFVINENVLNITFPNPPTTGYWAVLAFEPSAPDMLSNVIATPKDGAVEISFTAGFDGGNPISNYEYSLDGGETWIPFSPEITTSPVTIPNLINGTAYEISLRSVNGLGTSPAIAAINVTPATTPSQLSNMVTTPQDGAVEISFVAGSDGGSPITNYEYSLDEGQTWISFDPAITSSPATITGLTNGTAYNISLRAINSQGVSPVIVTDNMIVPGSPSFTSTPAITIPYGEPYNYTILATTENNLTTRLASTTLPAWLDIVRESTAKPFVSLASARFISVAGDTEGNIYAIVPNGEQIYKWLPDLTPSSWKSGMLRTDFLVGSIQIANGYIYISRNGNSIQSITRVPLNDPSAPEEVFASTPNGVISLAYKDGFIYASNRAERQILKINETTKEVEVLLSAVDGISTAGLWGLTFDNSGSLYISTFMNNSILKYDGTNLTTVLSLPRAVTSIVTDKNNDFYLAIPGEGIRKYTSDFSSYQIISPEISLGQSFDVRDMSVTPSGDLIYVKYNTSIIDRLKNDVSIMGTPTKDDVGEHPVVLRASNEFGFTEQSFTITVTDDIAPQISTLLPSNNVIDVSLQPTLTITFDEEVVLGDTGTLTVNNGSKVLRTYDLSLTEDRTELILSEDSKTLSVELDVELPIKTVITIGITPGFVSDMSDNTFAGFEASSETWSFTTIFLSTITSAPSIKIPYGQPYNYTISTTSEVGGQPTLAIPTLPAWLSFEQKRDTLAREFAQVSVPQRIVRLTAAVEDSEGNIYAIQSNGEEIFKIQPNGNVSSWKSGMFVATPGFVYSLVIANGYIYIARYLNNIQSITRVPLNNPNAQEEVFASIQNGVSSLFYKNGYFYASNNFNGQIFKINEKTRKVELLLSIENGIPERGPWGMTVDNSGNLYIATFSNKSILKFDGITLRRVLSDLPANVTSILADENNDFYLSMYGGGVRKYTSDFSYFRIISQREDDEVFSMSITPNGDLIYPIHTNNLLYRFKAEPLNVLMGTPAKDDVGEHPVVLRASNEFGFTEQSFTITVTDDIAPQILTLLPANNTTDVALQPTLTITFDEEVVLGDTGTLTVNDGNAVLRTYDLSLTEDRTALVLSDDNKTLSVELDVSLPINTAVTIGITSGFVSDMSDNDLEGFEASYGTWSFTTINKLEQTITFPEINTKTYGDPLFVLGDSITERGLTVTYTAIDPSVVSISGNQATILKAGSTTIKATQAGDEFTFAAESVERTLEINQASLQILASNKSKIYGSSNPILTFNYKGLVNGDSKIATEPIISTTATASSGVGTYPITLTGGEDANYAITLVAGELEVTKAALTITAGDKSKIYGSSNPILTFSYKGLVNGDSKVATEPSISTTATASSGVGTYPITLTGGEDANYAITLVAGELEVTKATLTITADNQSKVYNLEDPEFTYVVNGLVGSDQLSGKLSRNAGEEVGKYAITLGTLTGGNNYQIAYLAAELEIIPTVIKEIFEIGTLEMNWGSVPNLPARVALMATNGRPYFLDVTWNESTLNRFRRGTYDLEGEVTETAWIKNQDDLKAGIKVTVLPKPAPEDILLSNNTFEGARTSQEVAIGALSVVDPIDNIHVLGVPYDLEDNRYFKVINDVLYWSSEDPAVGRTKFKVVVRVTDRDFNTLDKVFEIIRTRKSVTSIEVFNTFTPEGDGKNDTWGVPELRYYSGVRIQIFDRGGERMFYTENPDIRWDGTLNGKELPIGTYYWTIEVRETGEVRKGMLNLLRK
ncbi:MBG domain-containing protein [Belliella aquatica]|uniref:Fibronectin type-III domain-containing protein n=1 Tax=Belliella aquatica TaxID=1323734 RepID=A0ABQ1N936_9BACT|nr:MBG domain-containing protein [Belliella aquatica]MCH7407678.1 gliding motility-associated C-terminal domain-containing protein [Belliella aquatica]GGC55017.1 hypothetical protein GCM10010993_36720 [Belliella aquatica]